MAWPRKVLHATAGYALTSAAMTAGARPEAAFVLTALTTVGVEALEQQIGGDVSAKDIVAGVTGAAVSVLWHELFGRRKASR